MFAAMIFPLLSKFVTASGCHRAGYHPKTDGSPLRLGSDAKLAVVSACYEIAPFIYSQYHERLIFSFAR